MLKQRELIKQIIPWIERDEIIVITGSRQVGKTSVIQLLLETITDTQKRYFDLEDLEILHICNQGPNKFIEYLTHTGTSLNNKTVIAIDEIQYLDNPSNFLKLIHDHYKTIKLIVSGSSSLEIQNKFKDSLAGRKIVFELDTLSFSEFLLFKNEQLYQSKTGFGDITQIINSNITADYSILEKDLLPVLLEYIIYGGYPKSTLVPNIELKQTLLKEIYTSYVRKDVKDISRIDDIGAFNKLIILLSSQISNLINLNEVSSTLGINIITLKKYLLILQNTFILSLIQPYFENKRKELTKMSKIFFLDTGLRNTIISNYQSFDFRVDTGALFENYVFCELKKRFPVNEQLFFWRTQSKAEVDFILKLEHEIIPIEVKSTKLKEPELTRSFKSFIDTYHPKRGIIINLSYSGTIQYKNCRISFLPGYVL